MKIGFAGIGRMGEPMVLRLLAAGFSVSVWNRKRDKLAAVIKAGAEPVGTPAQLASGADTVLTMVTDDIAVEAIYSGPEGLLTADVRGKLLVDMSTILPDTVKHIAAMVRERGGRFVDAPVAGTVQPARDGRLLIFAGGDSDDIQRLKPTFDALARRVEHLGPIGSGAAMKLVHNALLSTYWGVLADAMAMGSRYGLELKRMLDVIGESPAAFAALPVKVPLLLGQSAEIGFNIANVRKDLRTIAAFAESLHIPMGIVAATLQKYEEAVAHGFAEEDVTTIVKIQRELPA